MHFLKSILFGALVLLFSATVVAQGHRGERRGFDLEKMTEQLDLTPAQATQLKAIHEEQRAAFAKLAEGLPEGERPDREQMKGLMQESREKMMKVLTPAQQEKLKAERQARGRQDRGNGERKQKMNEELRSELRAYRSETITPKFIEVRSNFDEKLSPTERTQIATLREAAKAELGERGLKHMSDRGGSPRGELRGGRGGEHSDKAGNREEYRAKMQAFKQKHKSDIKAVRDIAQAHKGELEAVRAELDAAKAQWKKDGDAIRAKHLTAEQLERYKARTTKHDEMQKPRSEGEGGRHGKRGGGAEHNDSFSRSDRGAFMFLLMDPSKMDDGAFEELDAEKLSVFPNPATEQTTLQFEVRSAGPVRVELIDASGKVIQTLLKGEQQAGNQELPVKLPASMGKTGLLRVTDSQGVRTIQVNRI